MEPPIQLRLLGMLECDLFAVPVILSGKSFGQDAFPLNNLTFKKYDSMYIMINLNSIF